MVQTFGKYLTHKFPYKSCTNNLPVNDFSLGKYVETCTSSNTGFTCSTFPEKIRPKIFAILHNNNGEKIINIISKIKSKNNIKTSF